MPAKKRTPRPRAVGEPENFENERQRILNRYWELAKLDPEATKGNITGQLKALDSLCEELGLRQATRASEPETASQGIYRSAWMRE